MLCCLGLSFVLLPSHTCLARYEATLRARPHFRKGQAKRCGFKTVQTVVLRSRTSCTELQNRTQDPRNSIIHEVLANRTGNPITLSVAYMAVARRLPVLKGVAAYYQGVPLYGAECPSHFVVRGYHADGETFFVDVFNSGAIMTLKVPARYLWVAGCDETL
eukprot:1411584-Rhodomonas_salina.1